MTGLGSQFGWYGFSLWVPTLFIHSGVHMDMYRST